MGKYYKDSSFKWSAIAKAYRLVEPDLSYEKKDIRC